MPGPDEADAISILEPNTSGVRERMAVMTEAAARGLRTYAMFCPLSPGIADSPDQIDRMMEFAAEVEAGVPCVSLLEHACHGNLCAPACGGYVGQREARNRPKTVPI